MSDFFLRLSSPELRFGDFLVPWGMVISVVGFLTAWGILGVMEHLGWTRMVANVPLFFMALALALGCLAGLVFAP